MEPVACDLAVKVAALEERMNTHKAEYRTDIARLAEDNAKRETRLVVVVATLIVAGVAVLGFLIRWPG